MNHLQCSHFGLSPVLLAIEALFLTLLATACAFFHLSQEGGLLENTQIILLALTMIPCLIGYKNQALPLAVRQCFFATLFITFFIICRELNYGRIFFHDESIPMTAEIKAELRALLPIKLLRGSSYTALALAAFFVVKSIFKQSLITHIRQVNFYLSDMVLLVLSFSVCRVAEKTFHNENIEEFFECMLYLTIFNIVLRYATNRKNVWNLLR